MKEEITYEGNLFEVDPVYAIGFNDGLEYSAKRIEEAGDDKHISVAELAELDAQSLRAAKREVKQQDFYDALPKNPDMYFKLQRDRDELLAVLQLLLDSCDWQNGACQLNEPVGAVLPHIILDRAREAANKNRPPYG